ncbi:uncharacterized protein CDAR_484951 [Caerostris darwini]|uniref:Uncharacterized protein n=1 Tax=Caerostris darwini TaxID=1538125 RepID=A0AAV4PAR5_9ARAC|nr:uncharacterized protein CDAR_484951 [Caerostris darwini]
MNVRKSPINRANLRSTPKRNVYAKENNSLAVAKIQPTSSKRVERIINGVRVTACNTITNVKSSWGGFSEKLKVPLKRTRSFAMRQQYQGLPENSCSTTPVKLYTPFNFVTPSPPKSNQKRISPRRCSFKSPTGRFRKDVQQLNRGLKERKEIEKTLCSTRLR